MTKKEKFLILVQTATIVRDIQKDRVIGAAVLEDAMSISENKIPNKYLSDAARDFVNWEYMIVNGGQEAEKPLWLRKEE